MRYTYSVVTVGESARSEPSNLVSIVPLAVPVAPANLTGTSPASEVVLSWSAPDRSISGAMEPSLLGYNIYRFPPTGEIRELGRPVNASPVTETSYRESPPYGTHRYVVTAVASLGPPVIESEPTSSVLVEFRDRFPPPPPASVVPLVEDRAVRLLWDAVEADDLAGYVGATVPSVSRLITRLKRQGVIKVHGRRIAIADRSVLMRMARECGRRVAAV